jgi:hypothetical protein
MVPWIFPTTIHMQLVAMDTMFSRHMEAGNRMLKSINRLLLEAWYRATGEALNHLLVL